MKKILIISGTNRDEALSPTVANTYLQLAKEAGLEAEIIDLRHLPHDFIISALYDQAGNIRSLISLEKK